jgi:mannose-6-phosphate isomerase-like protein (cupin superfamily)
MKELKKIEISTLPWVANICNQRLKEAWKSEAASIAYVEMDVDNISLFHRHKDFTEIYYVLSGQGMLCVNGQEFFVEKDVLVEIPPDVVHNLKNTGNSILCHLVISVPAFSPDDVEVLDE